MTTTRKTPDGIGTRMGGNGTMGSDHYETAGGAMWTLRTGVVSGWVRTRESYADHVRAACDAVRAGHSHFVGVGGRTYRAY